jgi:hypothetical protein
LSRENKALEDANIRCAGLANSMEKRGKNEEVARNFIARSLLVTWQESEKRLGTFVLLRVVSYAGGLAAW